MYKVRKNRMSKSPEDRFWEKVNKEGPMHPRLGTRCWVWTASLNRGGYGQLGVDYKVVRAHQFSWELHNGPIPDGEGHHGVCVLHKCDNRACVRPSHLYLGDHQDNMEDAARRGRMNGGNGSHKLSFEIAQEIRRRYRSEPISQERLGREYGVSGATVWAIVHNKTYKTDD